MPDTAPLIVGKLKADEIGPPCLPSKRKRKWRIKSDFPGNELDTRRAERCAKASEQNVETFVSDEWTFEYDLVFHGLGKLVYRAASLALADDRLNAGSTTQAAVLTAADANYVAVEAAAATDQERLGSHVYALFEDRGASKAIAAQYLAELLEKEIADGTLDANQLRALLSDGCSADTHQARIDPFSERRDTHCDAGAG